MNENIVMGGSRYFLDRLVNGHRRIEADFLIHDLSSMVISGFALKTYAFHAPYESLDAAPILAVQAATTNNTKRPCRENGNVFQHVRKNHAVKTPSARLNTGADN